MEVLEGILSESKDYYLDAKKKINKKILSLPLGSVKERNMRGNKYFYLQDREGEKIVQKYLGKDKPIKLMDSRPFILLGCPFPAREGFYYLVFYECFHYLIK